MRQIRWTVPIVALIMLFSSVGVLSAQTTNTAPHASTIAADVKTLQQTPVDKEPGDRKGYVGVFTAPSTDEQVFTLTTKAGDTVEIRIPQDGLAEIARTSAGPRPSIRFPSKT